MTVATSMVHPAFAAAAEAAAGHLGREGELGPFGSGPTYRTQHDGITLSVRLSGPQGRQLVEEARHRSAADPLVRGTLDVFCRAIEGSPLQEAADHGAIYALDRLGTSTDRPVPGMLTPRSAGAAFILCERLIRDILGQHQQATGDRATRNFWNAPLSPAWQSQTADERLASLRPLVAEFLAARGRAADDVQIARIEKARRVVATFGAAVRNDDKPELLMALERHIRRATGNRLEMYMDEMKDNNQIRRLGPNEASS